MNSLRRLRAAAALVTICLGLALVLEGKALAIGAIRGYQRTLAPIADRAGIRCRFTPTCSRYAEAVIGRDGLIVGGWKAIARVARCGPWTPMGTVDNP